MACSKTIIYVGGFELPDKNAAAHRVLNNGKIMLELGYRVIFCGVDRDAKDAVRAPLKLGEFEHWPTAYPKSKGQWIRYLLDFQHIRRVFDAYDDVGIAIAYNMHAVPLALLRKYCKKRQIKLIADITEWYENRFSLRPVELIKWADTELVMRFLHKKADGIIAISTYLRDYYQKSVPNTVLIPPLVDIAEKKWHQESATDHEGVVFVYSGSPGSNKDKLGLVIGCMAELSTEIPFAFRIFGLTREAFLRIWPDLEGALNSLGEKVQFYGMVSHGESVKALLSGDYCIFLRDHSRKNKAGFSTKFVECVTCGVGLITNDIADVREWFPNDGRSQLLSEVSHEALCRTLQNVLAADTGKERSINTTFDYRSYKEAVANLFSTLENKK